MSYGRYVHENRIKKAKVDNVNTIQYIVCE